MMSVVWKLTERIRQLEQEVSALRQEVKHLRERSGGSKPKRGQAGALTAAGKPAPKSLRRSAGRKPGGQTGHAGRTLEAVNNPDRIELHRLEGCSHCLGKGLGTQPVLDYESRQVFDLPARLLEVTEHRAQIKLCPHCGQEARAAFPASVNAPVQYGAGFRSLMVYLNQQQLIPCERLTQLCKDVFGQPLSAATVVAATEQVAAQLKPFEEKLVSDLIAQPLLHVDESGLRVSGKLWWLHVASTSKLTFYGVHAKRGRKAMAALGVLGRSGQWLVHDFFKSYLSFQDCLHAFCNEHLLRELAEQWEEHHQLWAQQMSELLLDLKKQVEQHGPLGEHRFKRAWKRYRAIVRRGFYRHPRSTRAGAAQGKAVNLLDRLKDWELSVLAFAWAEAVPFTNNQAEQDIRMIKVRQKISGCFRTLKGARIFCRIRSYISTCRKQGRNVWEAIRMAVNGTPFLFSAPPAAP